MATSRGKDFEGYVKRDLEKIEGVDVIRLYDPVGGYSNVKNICDFIVYKKPYMLCLECKSTNENTLNYAEISQYTALVNQLPFDGVKPGVLIWYIKHKQVYWVSAEYMKIQREECNKKSINIKDLQVASCDGVIKIDIEVKRINPVCDFNNFLDRI